MKTLSKLGMLAVLGSTLFLSSCEGEYYVAEQPAEVYYDYGTPPYADGVWVGDDWVWSGGVYVHNRGHWEHRREGHTYVKGSWEHTNRGYRWHKSHWQ